MQCKEVEAVLEQNGLESLPEAARIHALGCAACQNYLADLTAIVAVARELPAEIAPPDRVWISLRAQLEAEGIIKKPVVPEVHSTWRDRLPQFSRNRGLIAATVGLLLVAGAVLQFRGLPSTSSGTNVEQQSAIASPDALEQTSRTLSQAESDLPNMRQAGTSPASQDSGSVTDDSLQKNLKAVDEFIVECEQHLSQDPQDQLAREYLTRAYQQKAELISAILDGGRSEN